MDWNIIIGQTLTQAIGVLAIIYALAAIGLNVHFGYTGLLNFGQAGFLAVAAYGLGDRSPPRREPVARRGRRPDRRRSCSPSFSAFPPCASERTTSRS